jgi:hypothetical protein
MAESESVESPKPGKKEKKVNHIKMVVIPDAKADTIDGVVKVKVDKDSSVVGDGTKSHVHFPDIFKEYSGRKINAEDIGKVLPWVHIAISNAKTRLAGIYHGNQAGIPSGVSERVLLQVQPTVLRGTAI